MKTHYSLNDGINPATPLVKTQKNLSYVGMITLISLANTFVCISLDMYLPAVPGMTENFHTTPALVNLTLVGFYLFLALGILFIGPLSEKYGRKPAMLISIAIYTISSGLCAVSLLIWQLIAFRAVEAIGAGGMVAVSTALIKDCFTGKTRETVLAVTQSISMIGPMVAPLIGALILHFFTWRATFWVLAMTGLLCLFIAVLFEESLEKNSRYHGSVAGAINRLFFVARNPGFSIFLVIGALLSAPYMAYIAVCSYVYIDYFGMNEQLYSLFFAFNTVFSILAPFIYIKIVGKFTPKSIAVILFIISALSGFAILLVGNIAPLCFMLSFLPFTLVESILRPFSAGILLEQQEDDTGSAAALINFVYTAIGSLGMFLASFTFFNYIIGLGLFIILFALISSLMMAFLLKSNIPVKFLK